LDLQQRFHSAVQSYWDARRNQQQKQIDGGKLDAGTRGAVTGGSQMGALEVLVVDILKETGLEHVSIKTRLGLELPGYYRPEKKWDLIVVSNGHLVCALEFKSQVGPSFGNNFNNRSEEAIGNSVDLWTAYREGQFGTSPRPFLGYFFLLEDCPKVHKPVKVAEPHFAVDSVFRGASYAKRYELLCRRLLLERNYDAACLTLATNEVNTKVSHPAADLAFDRFVIELEAAGSRFAKRA
jgi:Restriction endonuclease XhoI